jgi:tagatose-6-phosphate ketose/aldose isomerase
MHTLGFESNYLRNHGAEYTAGEIVAQPQLWLKIYKQITRDKNNISSFLDEALPEVSRIILTGAGTSALWQPTCETFSHTPG